MDIHLPRPRHLRSPGDDGYRTPTIEDAEKDLALQDNLFPLPPGTRAREAHTSALEALHRPLTRKSEERGEEVEDDDEEASIDWKKRIRHLTWAFFTLTMATGGIANVLYTSKANHLLECVASRAYV